MYLMHKYWARKPHNVVAEYIKKYSEEGEIVLDPFCGSGVTAIESLRLGRKVIAIDINPIATFITRMTAIPINLEEFKKSFEKIKENCKSEINNLYKTKCPVCKREVIAIHTEWRDTEPVAIWYKCKNCKNKKLQKKSDATLAKEDLELLKEIEHKDIPYWIPLYEFYYDSGNLFKEGYRTRFMKKEKSTSVADLFTKRNLIALSILYNEIEKIKDNKIKDLMKFTFTSTLAQTSKLIQIEKSGGGFGWIQHSYWIPLNRRELNVWHYFENRYKKILKGKEQSNSEIKKYKEAKDWVDFMDPKKDANILISTQSASDLSNLQDNSIDYIFTDPPYGGAIQYLELSAMWASWLKFDLDFKNEITINKEQKKDLNYYHKKLHSSFKEIYRVLKPNKYLTLTFHNTDIKVWNSILKAVIFAGFDLEKIIYQPPATASAKGSLQPYGSAVGDYYIRFKKSSKTKKTDAMVEINKARYERVVVDTAKEIIADRGEPVPYQYILNGIIPELDKHGVLLKGDKDIEEVMKSYINKE
ncbi:MAG: DNA methyltransferase, partial [Methanosarcinales archaeon]